MITNWKGDSTNYVIPTNSRPFTNNDSNLKTLNRTAFKANPLKHWRKQLHPYYHTKSSKQVSIDQIDAPGSAVYVGSNDHDCSLNNFQLLKENITLLNSCTGTRIVDENNNNASRCVGGSHNIKRSGSTNIKKNYYRNYTKYLHARCKSYEQNMMLGEKQSKNVYKGSKCLDSCKTIIYKPSNIAFSQHGSVSASTNILRKKNQAITNNSASLKTAYGKSYVKAIPYNTGSTGYEIAYVKGNNTQNTCPPSNKCP